VFWRFSSLQYCPNLIFKESESEKVANDRNLEPDEVVLQLKDLIKIAWQISDALVFFAFCRMKSSHKQLLLSELLERT
jgi:hypothetical protein